MAPFQVEYNSSTRSVTAEIRTFSIRTIMWAQMRDKSSLETVTTTDANDIINRFLDLRTSGQTVLQTVGFGITDQASCGKYTVDEFVCFDNYKYDKKNKLVPDTDACSVGPTPRLTGITQN